MAIAATSTQRTVFASLLVMSVLVLLAADGASAATSFRHQFQYDLKDDQLSKVPDVIAAWTWWAQNVPAAGKPSLFQFGKDLGIGAKLYSFTGTANVNVDVAGRLDFPTEDALRAFWKFVANNATYIKINKELVKDAFRIQYIVNSCTYPPAGTYIRHSFEYQLKPSSSCSAGASVAAVPSGTANVNNIDIQKTIRAWTKFCQEAPDNGKPVSCVFGADLGLGKELYPSNVPNMAFAGSMDFKSEADITAFWKYTFNLPAYKDLVANNLVAARIQYAAKFA